MGFLSGLGNIVGGFFGDPGLGDQIGGLFGGGNSNTPTNLSNVLGGAAAGMANQQGQQAALAGAKVGAQQNMYQNALQQALMKGLQLPSAGAQMAARGDVQSNIQDMTPNFTPGAGYSFSGGLRPSLLGPNARQAGQNLSNAGLSAQTMSLPTPPNLTAGFPSSTPSGLQNALQYGALGTGILGALMPGQSPLQQLLAQLMKQGGQQNQLYPTGGGGSSSDTGDDTGTG